MSKVQAVTDARIQFHQWVAELEDEDLELLKEWSVISDEELYKSALDMANPGTAEFFPLMILLDRLLKAKEKWYGARGYL